MVVRMFEYDVQIAMQHAELDTGKYIVEFPQSAILYLRSTANTPDYVEIQIVVPGDSCSYRIPAIKVKDYTVDNIYQKQLYFLVPFYIFVYEKSMKECEKNEAKLEELGNVFLNIRIRLEEVCKSGIISEYYLKTILDMAGKVVRNIAKKYVKTTERIGDIMGGKILEYEAKTIMNEGRAEGRKEGGNIMVYVMVQDGDITPEKGANRLGITIEELKKRMQVSGYKFPESN